MTEQVWWHAGRYDAITDVAGIRVGHWTDRGGATGCTVIRCEGCAAAAVDTRGGAPGTRETDVLGGPNLVRRCHAIVFAGGSAFGLEASSGVVRYLAERDVGFETTVRNVPIVSSAILFDLAVGRNDAYPNGDAGYMAARRAKGGRVQEGSVGAGTGATVAKMLGHDACLKGGIGTASLVGPRGIVVGALVANNASGHIFDPDRGALLAGPRGEDGRFVELPEAMQRRTEAIDVLSGQNTTLVCVATNAVLEHHHVQRLAIQAHDGLARTVVPTHTFGDGDVAYAVTMGTVRIEPHDAYTVGVLAARAVERAVVKSVLAAKGLKGVPSATEWTSG